MQSLWFFPLFSNCKTAWAGCRPVGKRWQRDAAQPISRQFFLSSDLLSSYQQLFHLQSGLYCPLGWEAWRLGASQWLEPIKLALSGFRRFSVCALTLLRVAAHSGYVEHIFFKASQHTPSQNTEKKNPWTTHNLEFERWEESLKNGTEMNFSHNQFHALYIL